ncbi:MAG: ABC transporter substrate-binding protein [Persicimonas sp.]
MLLTLGLMLSACKTGKGKSDADDLERQPPITAKSDDAQRQFERAKELLEDGQYDEAREAFRLLQAEYGDDPVAEVAELYLARTLLEDIDLAQSADAEASGGKRRWREAAQLLAPLADTDDVDRRIRYAAKAYYGLALSVGGATDDGLSSLADYPGASLSDVVLTRDRAAIWVMLTESFYRAGRYADVLETAARLHDHVASSERDRQAEAKDGARSSDLAERDGPAQELTEERGEAAPEGLRSVVALARQRAFDASREDIDEVDLQDYLASDMALLRAAAGWGVLSARLDEGVSESSRPALEDLFNRIAPDLVEVGAAERAAELSMRLASAGGPKRLAIGFLLPLTGSHQAIGQRAMAGALVAMRSFHDVGHPEVTLVFQDSQAKPADAFEALVDQDVLAIVGPLDVRRARKFAPLADQHEIPLITLTTESARPVERREQMDGGESAEEGDPEEPHAPFVFRNFIDAAAESRAAARIAYDEIGDRKAAVVYPDVGYGDATSAAFADEFRSLGGRIVAEIPYDRSQTDFAPVAKQLARSNPEAVFVPDSADKVAELTAFFANENIWGLDADKKPPTRSRRTLVHYLGTSLWEHPVLIRQSASYVEGATIPVWFSSAVSEGRVGQFVDRFEAVYGRQPENFEAFSYDTVNWLRSLMLERGMRRPEAIRDALLAGDQHHGVTGRAQMTARGEPARALRFVTPSAEGFEMLPFSAPAVRRAEDESAAEDAVGADPDDEASAR